MTSLAPPGRPGPPGRQQDLSVRPGLRSHPPHYSLRLFPRGILEIAGRGRRLAAITLTLAVLWTC